MAKPKTVAPKSRRHEANGGGPLRSGKSRIAALVQEIEKEWELVAVCEQPRCCRNDSKYLLENASNEAMARIEALEQMLAIEEPATADDALAIICLLSEEFLAFTDQEQPCDKRKRKVSRMIATVGRWLWRHAGAQTPLCHRYALHRTLLTWEEVSAEARKEARTAADASKFARAS